MSRFANLQGCFAGLLLLGASPAPAEASRSIIAPTRCSPLPAELARTAAASQQMMVEPGQTIDVASILNSPSVKALRAYQEAAARTDWANLCRYKAANAEARRPDVVFIGDSITENWLAGDPSIFGRRWLARGIGGQISSQVLLRFQQDVIALRPRAVHIMVGTNDIAGIAEPVSDEEYKNNVRAMVQSARSNHIAVVLASIPPVSSFPWAPGSLPISRIARLNAWLSSYAASQNAVFADYTPMLATPAGGMQPGLSNDGVHPNRLGYEAIRGIAKSAIATAFHKGEQSSSTKRDHLMTSTQSDEPLTMQQASGSSPATKPGLPPFSEIKDIEPVDGGAHPLPFEPGADDCGKEQWFEFASEESVRNVTRPNILPILPQTPGKNRTAIIVAPGGGFTGLRYQGEGSDVARRLADQGIVAFVLKYRTKCTPVDRDAFIASFADAMTKERPAGNADFPIYPPAGADVRASIAYVRAHAEEFGVDPAKIGILGFSAGAIAALAAVEQSGTPDAPDFTMLIYPQLNVALKVPSRPAPMFLAIAGDDDLFGQQDFSFVQQLRHSGGSVEMHFYSAGGHGFGLARRDTTSDYWQQELNWWLGAQRLLPEAVE